MLYPLTGHAITGSNGGLYLNLRPEPDHAQWEAVECGGPLDAPEVLPYGATRTWKSTHVADRFYSSDSVRRTD